MQIGNVWEYQDSYNYTYGFTTMAIKDTIMSNGFKYTLLLSDQELDPLYFRQTDSKLFNYKTYFMGDTTIYLDELWYDFSKTTGDTVIMRYFNVDTITIEVIDNGMIDIFGEMHKMWSFLETSKRTSGYAIRTIVDSIGLISYQYEGGIAFNLIGARINGINYGTITSVENSQLASPKEYLLYQNYPNPFNPSTVISYKLTVKSDVRLRIYDILGREIALLVNEVKNAGNYTVEWDGKNSAGELVGSGIYFYRLTAGKYKDVKKMVLIR